MRKRCIHTVSTIAAAVALFASAQLAYAYTDLYIELAVKEDDDSTIVDVEYEEDGKNDFICTNAVTYYIRDGELHAVVQMRSNDVVFGYKNDYAWQLHVLEELVHDYNSCKTDTYEEVKPGDITWQVQNLHVYERHFHLVK